MKCLRTATELLLDVTGLQTVSPFSSVKSM